MLMKELIEKKRDGERLSADEIDFVVRGSVSGAIPDYQISALLMAICFRGMTEDETFELTMSMLNSGDALDLSAVSGIKADKHSTGGVGDKTSLILIPMLAAVGVKMAKMSGRGLGHTGGTIDKLLSIPGLDTALDNERFLSILNEIGCVISESTADLAPADKKLYALRDVTATVESLPLIVSSIMSKKLAAASDIIVLDVKTGGGSFMKTEPEAFELAKQMVRIGNMAGCRTAAVVTDMDEPLGYAVGNALEVIESVGVLSGEGRDGNLRELCIVLGSVILEAGGLVKDNAEARAMLEESIESGAALGKFAEMVGALGGDERAVYDVSLLPSAPVVIDVPAPSGGYVLGIDAEGIGEACLRLGGGRVDKDSVIDPSVGIVLVKKRGDSVTVGEALARIHAADIRSAEEAAVQIAACYTFTESKPEEVPLIKGIVR